MALDLQRRKLVERWSFLSIQEILHDILRNYEGDISVLKKKQKKNDKIIFLFAWNIMFTDY